MLPKSPKKRRVGPPTVKAHSYNPANKTMDITFHGNRTYRYHDVTARQYDELKKAHSVGGFLHAYIIGKCDVSRLDD